MILARSIAAALLATALGCAHVQTERQSEAKVEVELTVVSVERREVAVTVRVPRGVDFVADFDGESTPAFFKYIDELSALDGTGRALRTERVGKRLRVEPTNMPVVLRYRYRVPQATPDEVSMDLPTMGASYARFYLKRAVLLPSGLEELPAHLALTVPAGWRSVTSWGSGTSFDIVRAGDVTQGQVALGEFCEARIAGDPEFVLLQIPASPCDRAYETLLPKLFATQTEIAGRLPQHQFLVVLQQSPLGKFAQGTSMLSALFVALPPNAEPLEFSVAGTIAHEMFHQWNGVGTHLVNDDDAWLVSEGFTNYFAVATLVRAGIVQPGAFEHFLTRYREMLQANPRYPAADFAAIQAGFSSDADLRELAYQKGPFVAVLLDLALRHDSGGKATLAGWMREIVRRYHAHPYEVADLRRLTIELSGSADGEAAQVFDRYLLGGGPLPLDALFDALAVGRIGPLTAEELELRTQVFEAR